MLNNIKLGVYVTGVVLGFVSGMCMTKGIEYLTDKREDDLELDFFDEK